ncbi:MAG: DegT/DnrJ/EryC1/StrS family aminotransferase [Chitinophagaceae bacterium]|nr:DegT/DnrJ/EryC1/StrS family aminotransferase [Chitinophagaceae bacterium]
MVKQYPASQYDYWHNEWVNKRVQSVVCGDVCTVTHLPDWSTVTEFEKQIAGFFGAPYAVAVDSCTHGLELCLRMHGAKCVKSPRYTYLSVPMLADKLGIKLIWDDEYLGWDRQYNIGNWIWDCATLWESGVYMDGTFMCLSFQYQKHLSLGRGGMILCPDEQSYNQLKKMSYDGRLPGIPWREQDIDTMGYHYYMTPETAALGLQKLPEAIATPPRIWSHKDYPDLTKMKLWAKH